MLKYSQVILEKVSFNEVLFAKELKKALSYLDKKERREFQHWCYHSFSKKYKDILDDTFQDKQELSLA